MSDSDNVLDQNISILELTEQRDTVLERISAVLLGESQPYDISFTYQGNEIPKEVNFTFDYRSAIVTD